MPVAVPLGIGFCIFVGGALAWTAYELHPLLVPALACAAGAALVSVHRPEIGVAVAYPLMPLGGLNASELGIASAPWLPIAAWITFLFLIAGLYLRNAAHSALHGASAAYGLVTLGAVAIAGGGLGGPGLRSAILGLMFFFATAILIRERSQVVWVLGGVAAAAILVGGVAGAEIVNSQPSIQSFATSSGELVNRASAGLLHPNYLGGFLLLTVPLALAGWAIAPRLRLLFGTSVVLAALGIYASFSRGALIGLALVPLLYLKARQRLVLIPLIAVVAVLASDSLLHERFATVTDGGGEVATRVDFWSTALAIWSEEPLAGAGLDRFSEEYSSSPVSGKRYLPQSSLEPPPHAHNVFLHRLAETGVVGLLALLAVLAAGMRESLLLRASKDRWLSAVGSGLATAIIVFLIHNQLDYLFEEDPGIVLWGVLGLTAAVMAQAARAREPSP